MARYRHSLPQFNGGAFLSDGGMETDLIFNRGVDLPLFASFPLVETEAGRKYLVDYYESFLRIARDRQTGFILDSATWRSNPDWGAQLGYDAKALDRVNREAIELIAGLRATWETSVTPIVLNGAIGPRGDGYKAGRMAAAEAEEYHAAQIASFARTDADMVSAITMNTIFEAVGIARAAKEAKLPCVVSFTVETDGRLVGGQSLKEAVETTDEATGGSPAYYMVNCAHPSHFDQAFGRGEAWVKRIFGVRANASAKSHQELDESPTIDIGDMADLSRRYTALQGAIPKLSVYGGCCGTDHRHIAMISEAVLPPAKLSA
ncbi:MAG TPA: homocysteine S-methyltransferase family protein [Rhizobiaceae bacterium]|nr:homocysteine S-methyltransferase family protein [Rhizobiaceae bacterium]